MASEQEMLQDLATADAAGDTALAQHIAGLIKTARQNAPPAVGTPEAALRGAAQGATLGFGDELEAGWKSLFGQPYQQTRDKLRADEANARSQHPYVYGGSEIAGSILPSAIAAGATGGTSLAPTLAKSALPLAAGQGALQGAGYSNADSARGLVGDTALGGGLGVLGYGLGQGLGAVGRAATRSARGLAVRATSRAADQAAQEVADRIASAQGALGGEVQKGNRIVENLRRLAPELTPEEQDAMRLLEQRLAASNRQSLPGQVGTIDRLDSELQGLKSGASEAFQARKAELLQPQILKDTMSLAKSYGEPLAANAIGGPTAGMVMGRTRMGKAIANRITRPGNQKALADLVTSPITQKTASVLLRSLQAAAQTEGVRQMVTQ